MGRRVLIGLAAACAAAIAPAATQAATLNATCATLQDQLDSSSNGDTVQLSAADGLCTGSYYLPDNPITLAGDPGAGFQPDSETSGRSLYGQDLDSDITVKNLVFKGSAGGDGGFDWSGFGAPDVEDSTFSGIANGYSGGALSVFSGGHVTVNGSTFTGNAAGLSGGGARIAAVSVTVTGSTFTDNQAGQDGGGLAVTSDASQDQAPPELRRGARLLLADADATVTGNAFTGNVAGNPTPLEGLAPPAAPADGTGGGGGLWVGKNGDAIDGPQLVAIPPYGTAGGGPVSVDFQRNLIDSNGLPDGDGDRSGGGAEFMGATVESYRNRLTRNSVGTAAGGEGDSEGGGLSVFSPSGNRTSFFDSVNDAIAGNRVGQYGDGAGVYIGTVCQDCNGTELDLYHSTVAGNVAGENGEDPGVSATPGDTLDIYRSIVKTNTVTGSDASADDPEIGGYTFLNVSDSDVCLPQLSFTLAPDGNGNICADPKLAGPADVHQTIGSPTVDTLADNQGELSEDWEGDARPTTVKSSDTPFDMGADELLPADYGITLNASPSSVTTGDTITYTGTVTNAGPGAAKGLTVTFSLGDGLTKSVAVKAAGPCTGSGPVTCPAGDVASAGSVSIALPVKAATAGAKTVTATVTGPDIDPTTGDHTATATATAKDAVPASAPSSAVQPENTSATTCGSKRFFKITLRKIKGITFKKATILVNGKKVHVTKRHGRLSAKVDLRKIGRKTIHVKIRATTTTGKVLKGTRTYHPCRPGTGKQTVPKL